MKAVNVMIVGVGGQGTLLASKVLGQALLTTGLEVRMSEVHGMSQRGGSVVTYVKCGENVYSPVIGAGEADFILSFEKLETARYLSCLKKSGRIVTNVGEIDPMPVIIGSAEYPHEILEDLKAEGVQIDELDALSLAVEAGTPKAVNIVLLGRLSRYFDLDPEVFLTAIDEQVKPAFREANRKAFLLGREA